MPSKTTGLTDTDMSKKRSVKRQYQKEYSRRPEVRARQAERDCVYRARPLDKCKRALYSSRTDAKRRGHKPCSATVEELLDKLSSVCHVCSREVGQARLSMDHCHATGKFRGWLCNSCNLSIGKMQDSPELLRKAASYLER